MNVDMLDICLRTLQCKKMAFSKRTDDAEYISEPCCIVEADGRVYCSAVPSLLPLLKRQTNLFHEPALKTVAEHCRAYIQAREMVPDKVFSVIHSYEIGHCPSESTKAWRLSGTENGVLLSNIADLVHFGPVFGVLENEKVVALCGAVLKDGYAEVYAETAPRYRRRGYAASCLKALSAHLLKGGYRVLYECREENEASRRTVERCGGTLICRSIRFKGRK